MKIKAQELTNQLKRLKGELIVAQNKQDEVNSLRIKKQLNQVLNEIYLLAKEMVINKEV